jgi:hypothetical protein
MMFGGIEAGGTKWVCAIGNAPDRIMESIVIPTGEPKETIARAAEFLKGHGSIAAVGVGAFGPIDLKRSSPTWGRITTTPKVGWNNTDLASALESALGVPVGFDTDVNAAALAEHRWAILELRFGLEDGVDQNNRNRSRHTQDRARPRAHPSRLKRSRPSTPDSLTSSAPDERGTSATTRPRPVSRTTTAQAHPPE